MNRSDAVRIAGHLANECKGQAAGGASIALGWRRLADAIDAAPGITTEILYRAELHTLGRWEDASPVTCTCLEIFRGGYLALMEIVRAEEVAARGAGMNYIVCGWYTPDYEMWADKLRANLDDLGEPHDIVEVPPMGGGWEANTCRKPEQILAAMERHPDKTIAFLDVDCTVRSKLSCIEPFSGDVGVFMRSKIGHSGKCRLSIRSGTIIIRSTPEARRFAHRWMHMSICAPHGTVDQTTLPSAIAATPGLRVSLLDNRYCAVPSDDVRDPVILHHNASFALPKIPHWRRAWHRWRAA